VVKALKAVVTCTKGHGYELVVMTIAIWISTQQIGHNNEGRFAFHMLLLASVPLLYIQMRMYVSIMHLQ